MKRLNSFLGDLYNTTLLMIGVQPTNPDDLTRLLELVLEAQQRELASAEKLLAQCKELNATLAALHSGQDVV